MLAKVDTVKPPKINNEINHLSFTKLKEVSNGITVSKLFSGQLVISVHEGNQRVLIEIHQGDARCLRWEATVIQEIASADPDIKVIPRDVFVVVL